MSTSPIPTSPAATATQTTNPLSTAKLNMQDFLNLLTQQLKNQDPLNPMSDSDFFAQMAQLGQVEGMDELNASSQMQQAQSLMGQQVSAMNTVSNASGSTQSLVTGVVSKVSVQNGTWMVSINQADGTTSTVPISAVQSTQSQQDLSQASNYIGHQITANVTSMVNGTDTTSSISGTVSGITLSAGVPSLTVKLSTGKTASVSLDQVTGVTS